MSSASEAAARGAALIEAEMDDACTVTRGGSKTFDPTTGTYTLSGGSTIYSGKCRVRPQSRLSARQVEAGDTAVTIWPFIVSLPIATTGVEAGDTVTVTASLDDDLVERLLLVKEVAQGTHLTARRLGCDTYQAASSG